MKNLLFIFICSVVFVYGAEGDKKEVDLDNLFKQLDTVISKKDDGAIEEGKRAHTDETTLEREKKFRQFNEASKKAFIFRAEKALVILKQLQKEYGDKLKAEVSVQRYSAIGFKSFAYVSGAELAESIADLKENAKIVKKLKNFEKLLVKIKDFEIQTISRALIIVEQEIMNLLDFGLKKIQPLKEKKEADVPVQLRVNKRFENVIVDSLSPEVATLRVKL